MPLFSSQLRALSCPPERLHGRYILFASMGAGIGAIVLLYSVGYMAEEKHLVLRVSSRTK